MSVLFQLATALWGLIVGAVVDAAEWLRKPGSKIKVVCAVLAFGFMVAGLSAYEKEQRIQDLSAQVVKVRADWKADAARLQSDVEQRDARLAEVAETFRAEAQKLEVLKRAWKKLAQRWVDLFNATRERFRNDTADIPIANKAFRLHALNRMAVRAEGIKNMALAAQLIEQAAKETGGAYTNRQQVEHSGPNGGPIQSADMTPGQFREEAKKLPQEV